ncbi:MAG TPA: hypothetical protein PK720_00380 [bacterium]|nr:hypothetical protein [bacterium]
MKKALEKKKRRFSNESSNIPFERFPVKEINVLKQVRQTFIESEIVELAENISSINLIQALSVAVFDQKRMSDHLKLVNKVWGTKHSLKNFRQYKNKYIILIAGEKRFRAIKLILADKKKYHQTHFKDGKVLATSHNNITSFNFINIQVSENIHCRPPVYEEAEYFERYYRAFRFFKGKSFSIAAFAKKVGRSAPVVREAIKFCGLPEKIRDLVYKGEITYSIACELVRIKNSGVSDRSLLGWAIDCKLKETKTKDLKKQITRFLQREKGDELFDFTEAEQALARKVERRRAISLVISKEMYAALRYISRLLSLEEKGLIGEEDSLVGAYAAYKGIGSIIKSLEKLIPWINIHKKNVYFKSILKKIGHQDLVKEIENLIVQYNKIG